MPAGGDRGAGGPSEPELRRRQRLVLRAGFGIVTALLIFATAKSIQIQGGLSDEAVEIYRRHARDDEILHRLRRGLWLAVSACRDFLLNPFPDRAAVLTAQLRPLKEQSGALLDELSRARSSRESSFELNRQVREFWGALERIPAVTQGLDVRQRYDFVQHEIAPRRSAIGDLIQGFEDTSRVAFQRSEAEFVRTRRSAEDRLLMTLGLSVVLGLAVAGVSLTRSGKLERQAAQQYEELKRGKADLQKLSARLIAVQEEERTRLSRELHDEIVQALATLRLELSRSESLSAAKEPEIRERLASAGSLAEKAIQTARNISLLLRPSLLDDLGLAEAVQWLAEGFSRRANIACAVHHEGLDPAPPEAVRTCVYRVLQEALHNCEKHSAATRVEISIRQSRESLTVTVEDNGRGFEVDSVTRGPAAHFGLLGMRERATAIHGALEVRSSPGRGTRLTLQIPLEDACGSAMDTAAEREVLL